MDSIPTPTPTLDPQQQADNDALASAVGAAAHQLGLDEHSALVHGHGHGHGSHSHPHSQTHSQSHSLAGTPTHHTHNGTSQSQADEDNAFLAHQLQQQQQHDYGHTQQQQQHRKEQGSGIGVGVGVGVGMGMGMGDDASLHHGQGGIGVGVDDADLAGLELPLHLQHQPHSGGSNQTNHLNQHSYGIASPPVTSSTQHNQHHHQQQQQQTQVHGNPYGTIAGQGQQSTFVRPPSIRKACDLCHAAKQKCSGDRPTCTRCLAGGWHCYYAPRQRRRTVPKEARSHSHLGAHHGQSHGQGHDGSPDPDASSPGTDNRGVGASAVHAAKKRKLDVRRNSLTFENGLDLKTAMQMALDMGMANEDEGEEVLNMSNESMLEVIAVDGYIADLPLATFVNNLPYTAPPALPQPTNPSSTSTSHPPIGVGIGVGVGLGGVDDYNNDTFPGDMDQHTTSALRDAIFSLNNEGVDIGGPGGAEMGVGVGVGVGDNDDIDPHLALLDLSHIQEDADGLESLVDSVQNGIAGQGQGQGQGHGEGDHSDLLSMHLGCNHPEMVPHLLSLLVAHPLDPKPHANTPLTMQILAPLARAIRVFHNIANCPSCMSSPQQTLPQLALISRLSTILTFPFPPTNSGQIPGAQIVLHGARLTGTGISDSIEQHIVHVVWDSWRASIREVFMIFERQARDVIASSANAASLARDREERRREGGAGTEDEREQGRPPVSSVEIQRAGLFFQAMSRLKQAMEEVEME